MYWSDSWSDVSLKGGVGCSINCRCEGCKNAFGRKDGLASLLLTFHH